MISKEQAEAIKQKIGSVDGPRLIKTFNSLGIGGESLDLSTSGYIFIPKTAVKNIPYLQSELCFVSKVGRSFKITEEGEKLAIDTMTLKQTEKHRNPRIITRYFDSCQSTGPQKRRDHVIEQEDAENALRALRKLWFNI